MKKIISIVAVVLLGIQNLQAQCSSVTNNFEMQLTQKNNHQLSVKIRHTNSNQFAQSRLPNTKIKLDGLVFAIGWPVSNADVKVVSCESMMQPFAIQIDDILTDGQLKKAQDHIVTFYQNAQMPSLFLSNWTVNEWQEIALIEFTGKLKTNEYFSFMNCDYGIANPNSFNGNSNTDPWLALLNESNEYLQFSPKMISELPNNDIATNTCTIYPVPTLGLLHVDIMMNASTNAVVKIMDVKGILVKTVLLEMKQGINSNAIDISNLSSGEYILQVSDGKAWQHTQSIIKQ